MRRAIVQKMKLEKLSQIQAVTIPSILRGENLIVQSQGGSGKTLSFVIGMLEKINVNDRTLQAICLANTRELANQIYYNVVLPLSQCIVGIQTEVIFKGDDDRRGKRSNSHLIVGTPGSVLASLRQRPKPYINTVHVKIFVVDEADFIISDPTFAFQTLNIRKQIPSTAQTLFFSSTYSPAALEMSRRIVSNATTVRLKDNQELILDPIKQLWVNTGKFGPQGKIKVLQDLYSTLCIQQSIIFVNSGEDADKLTAVMRADQFSVSTLHGGIVGTDVLTAEQMRDEVMREFRSGESKVLITTNAFARGLDVPSVAVVVNYDLPRMRVNQLDPDPETYIHRICRTGRFGRSGIAITFIDNKVEYNALREIESYFSPDRTIISKWDMYKLKGLTRFHNARSEEHIAAPIYPTPVFNSSTDEISISKLAL